MISIERVGRRSYFRGDTFPVKEEIKLAGAHWDTDTKAWWVGRDAVAQELLPKLNGKLQQLAQACAPREATRQSVQPPRAPATGTFRRLEDGWGVSGKNLVAGEAVRITRRDGTVVLRVVERILSTHDQGWQLATLAPEAREDAPARGRTNRRWTPCGYPGCSPWHCDECDGKGLESY